jgi:hypothetical protein
LRTHPKAAPKKNRKPPLTSTEKKASLMLARVHRMDVVLGTYLNQNGEPPGDQTTGRKLSEHMTRNVVNLVEDLLHWCEHYKMNLSQVKPLSTAQGQWNQHRITKPE